MTTERTKRATLQVLVGQLRAIAKLRGAGDKPIPDMLATIQATVQRVVHLEDLMRHLGIQELTGVLVAFVELFRQFRADEDLTAEAVQSLLKEAQKDKQARALVERLGGYASAKALADHILDDGHQLHEAVQLITHGRKVLRAGLTVSEFSELAQRVVQATRVGTIGTVVVVACTRPVFDVLWDLANWGMRGSSVDAVAGALLQDAAAARFPEPHSIIRKGKRYWRANEG